MSGSWVAVIPFAVDNPWPFVIWSLMTAGIGFLAALLWRNATHKREMVNKDGRIRELELELEKRDTDVEAAAAAERVRIEEGKKARRIAEEEAERKRDEDMRETISRIDIDALAVLYMIERNGSIEWNSRRAPGTKKVRTRRWVRTVFAWCTGRSISRTRQPSRRVRTHHPATPRRLSLQAAPRRFYHG